MANHFTWIPIYQELANELARWQNRQGELITYLESLRTQGYTITPLLDKDENDERFLIREMDPFTFFGVFNRRIGQDQRIAIIGQMKRYFNLQSLVPEDFDGIPVLFPQSSWFIAYQSSRDPGDVGRLWRVFQLALTNDPLKNPEFLKAFDDALNVRQTNFNLTVALYWIRPHTFLNLDRNTRNYLQIKTPSEGLNAAFYVDAIRSASARGKSFPELSYEAWHAKPPPGQPPVEPTPQDTSYWLVGAYWSDKDPADQTNRFLEESIWQNGYTDRLLEEVKSMRVGDKIAIKAVSTQRNGLPFDNRNKTVSRMAIKAIGTIMKNRNDGRTVEVEWDHDFQEKSWYFYTYRPTVWHLRTEEDYPHRDLAQKLIEFVWHNKPQDYDWFCELWFGTDEGTTKPPPSDGDVPISPYSIEDMIASGVFLSEDELRQFLDRLRIKKAMILQGPPGVGKTFIARKLAYALMEEKDDARIETAQFHQSYSYDDFVRGWRPSQQAGTFTLQNGIFYEFCERARNDPDREYVFIIDEINRGNLSQIFGELLMLIEHDKRKPDFAVQLLYRHEDEPRFYIPQNVYLLGLMNLADRSLAMVDYALRRRFAFMTLKPQYESNLFRQWLEEREMHTDLIQLIVERLTALNKEIRDDPLLGENYQVGHSFFCPNGENFAGFDKNWYEAIVQTEIVPLLKEYWFDNAEKANEAERKLVA